MKQNRTFRYPAISFLLLLLTMVLTSGSAMAAAHLDTGFGTAGIAVLPHRFVGEFIGAGLLSDGRVVVSNHEEALALLPSGREDPTFGDAGVAGYAVPPGSERTYVYGFGVDAEGRPVVVGNTGHEGTEPEESVFVERLTSGGLPDPTFAGDGYIVGDIPLPPREAGTPNVAGAVGLEFDSLGRILVAGGAETGSMTTKNGKVPRSQGFIARLGASGSLDPSFGAGGTLFGPGGTLAGVDENKLILGEAATESVSRLGEDGRVDPSFGKGGSRAVSIGGGRRKPPRGPAWPHDHLATTGTGEEQASRGSRHQAAAGRRVAGPELRRSRHRPPADPRVASNRTRLR
jgi:uncharacterized delta-60 repeat protein